MLTEKDLEEMIERLEKSNRKGKETALKVYRELLEELRKDPKIFRRHFFEIVMEYEKEHPEEKEKRNSRSTEAIIKFNEMLQDPEYTTDQAWEYLIEEKNACEAEFFEKHGFHMNMDYLFLYPQITVTPCLDFPLLYPNTVVYEKE